MKQQVILSTFYGDEMGKESFILHTDAWEILKDFSDEQCGRLLKALLCYQIGEAIPELDVATKVAFSFMAAQLDRDNDKYAQMVEKRRAAGKKSAEARQQMPTSASTCQQVLTSVNHTDTDTVTDTDTDTVVSSIGAKAPTTTRKKAAVFKKPSVEDVKQYCDDRNNEIDAEAFVDYYEANGWKVGRTPMKDWKAAVRTWERKQKPKKSAYSASFDAFDKYVDELEGTL